MDRYWGWPAQPVNGIEIKGKQKWFSAQTDCFILTTSSSIINAESHRRNEAARFISYARTTCVFAFAVFELKFPAKFHSL